MKILITGGTGFIGSRLALACLSKGHSVRVLGQVNTPAEQQNCEVVEAQGVEIYLGSVTDSDTIKKSLQDIDWVFHLAAAQHEANIPDQRFWDVNVSGTKNLLEGSIKAGVQKFIHGSTIGVYGAALEGAIDEASAVAPDNIYGTTKLEGEKVVLSYQEKLPVVIIRISETYGPGDRRLLKLFKAINKNIFFVIGNGENKHHLIYIDDLIQGMLAAAESDQAVGEVLLLAGKEVLTTREMAVVIAEELGKTIPRIHAPLSLFLWIAMAMEATLRPLGIQPPIHRRRMDFFKKNLTFSLEKSSKVLDFKPEVGFVQGIRANTQWYKDMGFLD